MQLQVNMHLTNYLTSFTQILLTKIMHVTFNLSNRKGLTININKKNSIQNLKSMVTVVLAV